MSVNKNKKRSPRKKAQSHGVQTITSMFKKQTESIKKYEVSSVTENAKVSPCRSLLIDDPYTKSGNAGDSDVEIIDIETTSPYFTTKKSKSLEGNPGNSCSRKRLSLRKIRSTEVRDVKSSGKYSDEAKPGTCTSHSIEIGISSIQQCSELGVLNSSQKENNEESGGRAKKTLSLRKRKSTEVDVSSNKSLKLTENKEVNTKLEKKTSFPNESHLNSVNNKSEGHTSSSPSRINTTDGQMLQENTSASAPESDLSSAPESRGESVPESRGKSVPESRRKSVPESRSTSAPESMHRSRSSGIAKLGHKEQVQKYKNSGGAEVQKTDKETTKKPDKDDVAELSSQKEEDDKEEDEGDKEDIIFRTPYYLENFRTILQTVLSDADNVNLYNEQDVEAISKFGEISEPAQKLYVRLFCRKWAWLTMSRVKYPEIAEDLTPIIQELIQSGFLLSSDKLTDLEKALKLLPAPELKSLAKMYHLNTSQNKKDIVNCLIKKSKQSTIGSMFKVAGHSASNIMLERAKKVVGSCFCLVDEPRHVFTRTIMLFSLTDTILDDDNASGTQNQIFRMLQVNIGATIYPSYTVNKQTQVFTDRDSLLRFSEASLLESDIMSQLEHNNYNGAYNTYKEATNRLEKLDKQKEIIEFDSELPPFLRPYTASAVYTRILHQGVDILQRRKNYVEAIELLEKLLSQEIYCQDYRGHWWERVALNYDAHLKSPGKAMDAVVSGLSDGFVKAGRRLALYLRAEKICCAPKSRFKSRMREIPDIGVKEAPKITIEGTVLSDNMPGMRYKFIMADPDGAGDNDDIVFCGVEELAMQHYKENGYPEGLHAEGSIISNLFGFFFWDIIFMDVPDAFHGSYQTHPFDMYSSSFYVNRRKAVDKRLKLLAKSEVKDLQNMMAKVWEEHNGELCIGLNWERFNSLEHAQGLVSCIGGQRLSKIVERYVKEPRHTRSGFPDLTMWNTEAETVKISEVKGPGDRLSHKQMLWLDYLVNIGIDAEVCYVKAVGSKKLKPTTA